MAETPLMRKHEPHITSQGQGLGAEQAEVSAVAEKGSPFMRMWSDDPLMASWTSRGLLTHL